MCPTAVDTRTAGQVRVSTGWGRQLRIEEGVVRTMVAQADYEAEAWRVPQGGCGNGGGRSERGGR